MELLQLSYFCSAAETENFSKTAQIYGVPPSDISQSIKRLEKELGTELFVRRPNCIRLNDKGCAFYKRISVALSAINAARAELLDDGESGALSICINTNRRITMKTIERFRRTYPEVDIYTKNGVDHTKEEFDLVIDNSYPPSPSICATKLLSEGISLAVTKDDPLVRSDTLNAEELAARPFVTMPESQSLYGLTVQLCKSMGFTPRIAVQSDDPFYVRKCVELGLGITFVPEISWRGQISEEIALIKLDGCSRDTFVFYDKSRYLPKTALKFQKMLVEEFAKEMNEYTENNN